MIDEAIKAVIDSYEKEKEAEAGEGEKPKTAEMAYSADGTGGEGSFMDFLALPDANS